MLNFTSALYLGMHHQSRVLEPWKSFSTGIPAALGEPELNLKTAQSIAELQGIESAVLAPSTLHLFWDLFGVFGKEDLVVYRDEGGYPIAQWGVERAKVLGATTHNFSHYNPDSLRVFIRKNPPGSKRVLILCDSFCPSCGKSAPVSEYLSIAEHFGGYLIIDDTQAFGILGHSPTKENLYGLNGGGILQWTGNANKKNVLVVSSLAKAFGVPVAVLSGSDIMIKRFKDFSETRVYCSPASNAVVVAAHHAITLNRKIGNKLRQYLLRLVLYFCNLMSRAGFHLKGGVFPVQTLSPLMAQQAIEIHEHLFGHGVRSVLHKDRDTNRTSLSFLINVSHKLSDINFLVNTLIKFKEQKKMEVCYERSV